ncbi:TniQ family protein [Streptomyces sp. H27-G5]|uniref:TniQ family protein n=1 Tax=Streptomyces sp. H27-G5 TaxID=2996698 RepID=UPI00226F707E|nr:TniQ family protein [Streptomyces sp. H27-G5]MCY0924011.1 TniQ family protein [Streptomyces sp. H27-G5]
MTEQQLTQEPGRGVEPVRYARWNQVPWSWASRTQMARADLPREPGGPVRGYVAGRDFRERETEVALYDVAESRPTRASGGQLAAAEARRTATVRVCTDCGANCQLPLQERQGRYLCPMCWRIATVVDYQIELRERRAENAAWARDLLGAGPLAIIWVDLLEAEPSGPQDCTRSVQHGQGCVHDSLKQLRRTVLQFTDGRSHPFPASECSGLHVHRPQGGYGNVRLMTPRTTPADPARKNKPLTAADLPIRVPVIHGETTASYLARTAAANAVELPRLLRALHKGRLPASAAQVHPGTHEVTLTAESLARLADLTGRQEDQLRRALPGLALERLHPLPAAAVRARPWPQTPGEPPLPACPLCLEDGAWLAGAGHRWRPCACGRRWECGDDGGYLIDTTPLPELSRALADHRALNHRVGPAGDALVADAHQVTLWWWVNRQVAHETWREREDKLGFGRHRRRAAPAVVYPEAVRLAQLMNAWESARTAVSNADPGTWLTAVAKEFDVPGIADGREAQPLWTWIELHPPLGELPAEKPLKTTEGRWELLPALHHRPEDRGPFQTRSCLRWVYGLPLTSTTELCPHCGGREPSCLWVPADDCPQNPFPASRNTQTDSAR